MISILNKPPADKSPTGPAGIASSLEAMSEALLAALDNKTPQTRIETALFLKRAFARLTPAQLNKKLLKLFVPPLLKNINDSAPEVRFLMFFPLHFF